MVFFFSFTVTVPFLVLVCVPETDGSDGADDAGEGAVDVEPDGAADDEAAGAGDTAGVREVVGSWEEAAEGAGAAEPVCPGVTDGEAEAGASVLLSFSTVSYSVPEILFPSAFRQTLFML